MNVPGPVRALAANRGFPEWADELPGLVAELERRWGVRVGPAYPSSTEAWVAEAGDAVVKVFVPGRPDKARYETTVLRLAAGEGCVRLLDADDERGALLLERIGPSLSTLGIPEARRHEILCGAAQALWRPAPDSGLPTGAVKARALAELIVRDWEKLGRPCSERAVEQALGAADRREAAHDDATAVLLHGDVHQWNTLRNGDGWSLVDPDGLLGERELDLGVLMREDLDGVTPADLDERAARIAALTGTDAAAIQDWGIVERLSNGLLGLQDGLEEFGRISLDVADRVAGE
jgi:streptomycin 6-kinase